MMRRLVFVIFVLTFCASTAWPKWKEEEQQYLDAQFKAMQDQIQALKTQVDTLSARLAELRQNQDQLQVAMGRQLRALQDATQMLSTMRMGGEENFTSLKSSINQMRTETQKSFGTLIGQPAAGPGTTDVTARSVINPPPTSPTVQVVQGYITVVDGNVITVDIGSSRGIHVGQKLSVFKAADPNSRVGVLEVTQVVDRDSSKAQVVTMNQGVRPEFSDVVRLE